jgi:hypothetical protein
MTFQSVYSSNGDTMKFDWTTRIIVVLTLASVGASFVRHHIEWLYVAINLLVAATFLVLLAILIKRNEIANRLALLWVVPCAMNGVRFLSAWVEKPWGMDAVLGGVLFLINLGIIWGCTRIGKNEIYP